MIPLMIKFIVSKNDNNNNNNQYDNDNRIESMLRYRCTMLRMQQRYGSLCSVNFGTQDEKSDNQGVRCYLVAKIFQIKFGSIGDDKIFKKKLLQEYFLSLTLVNHTYFQK